MLPMSFTGTVTLTTDKTTLTDSVKQAQLVANLSNLLGSGEYISFYDDQGTLVHSCAYYGYPTASCSTYVAVPLNTTRTYTAYVSTAAPNPGPPTGIEATSNSVTITNVGYVNQSISLSFDPAHVIPYGFLLPKVTLSPAVSYPYLISFYTDAGKNIGSCPTQYGAVPSCTMSNGFQPGPGTSNIIHVFVAQDAPANAFPTVDVRAHATAIGYGDPYRVQLTVSGSTLTASADAYARGSGDTLEFYDLSSHTMIAYCAALACATTVSGSTHLYVAYMTQYSTAFPPVGRYAHSNVEYAPDLGPDAAGNPAGNGDCRPCHGDPIDTATGQLIESATDLSVPGRGVDLAISRTWRGADAGHWHNFGYGWTDAYAMSVHGRIGETNAISSASILLVTQENGTDVQFTRNSNGTYTPVAWARATLVYNANNTYTFTRNGTDRFTFDGNGRLVTVADLNGNTITLSYTGLSLKPNQASDAAGRTLTFSYTGNGEVDHVTDTAGRTVSYGYDSALNLASVTDPAGHVTHYSYDSQHQLTSITTPAGSSVTNVYDDAGRVTAQTDALNHTTTFGYGSDGTVTMTSPAGRVTVEAFAAGQLHTRTVAPGTAQAGTWTYTYDPVTLGTATVTDPLGHVWSYGYDSTGHQTSATDPLSHTESWTYNSLGEPLTHTDRDGVTTTNTYDANGNLLTTSTPLTGTPNVATTTFTYGDSTHPGDVTAVTDPRGKTTHLTYDSYGQVTAITDAAGDTITHTYTCAPTGAGCRSNIGWTYTTVSPRGNVTGATPADYTTHFSYDDDGHTLSVTDPLGHTATSTYDGDGHETSSTDANQHTTSYSYDLAGRLTTTTRPDTTTLTSSYDADGNTTAQTDAATHATTYSYDPAGRLSSTTDPLNRTTSYTYDTAGRRITTTNPDSQITSDSYDNANRLTGIDYSDTATPDVTYTYDNNGRRTSMTDGTGTTSYSYDSLGRTTDVTNGGSAHVGYSYDLAGNVTALTYPNGHTVSRSFDDVNRLTGVTDWSTHTTNFGYDADSGLTGITYPNGVTETTTFDHADRLTAINDTTATTTLASYTYTRDAAGALTSTTPTGVTGQTNETYGHSVLDQLTGYTTTASTGSYGYDNADNPTTLADGTTQTFDTANQLTSSSGPGGSLTYSYNNRGDRTGSTSTTSTSSYTYNQADQLATSTTGGITTGYSYDGDGLRATKATNANTTTFAWDAESSADQLLLTDGTTSYLYGPAELPIEQTNDAGTSVAYVQHDQQASTRVLTDPSGAVTGTYTYDPYGQTTSHTGTTSSALQYDGQYHDAETGFYYLRARYYDPTTAQFLTSDPLESLTRQPYTYAANGPLDALDPAGLWSWHKVFSKSFTAVSVVAGAAAAFADLGGKNRIGAAFGFISVIYAQDASEIDCGWGTAEECEHAKKNVAIAGVAAVAGAASSRLAALAKAEAAGRLLQFLWDWSAVAPQGGQPDAGALGESAVINCAASSLIDHVRQSLSPVGNIL